jgi:hypothetical protein
MSKFEHTTAKVAAWNLAGFNTISSARLALQVEGLALLDAEVITLVEVKPFDHMQAVIDGLAAKGCAYESVMLPQASDLNIGVLFKKGVKAKNPRFIDDSDLPSPPAPACTKPAKQSICHNNFPNNLPDASVDPNCPVNAPAP